MKTPYAKDFLWHQLQLAYSEIRKPKYRTLLKQFFEDELLKTRLEKKADYRGRNYEGGMLEATASLVSLAMCMYDNYPEIDIDLLLTAFILYGFCSTLTKRECYERLKDYPEVIPFLFKKKRKKPSLELSVFDALIKLDNKIFQKLQQKRKSLREELSDGKR